MELFNLFPAKSAEMSNSLKVPGIIPTDLIASVQTAVFETSKGWII